MTQKTHTLWVERYRPDTLEGYIGNEEMKAKFAQFIESSDIPHLLLTGPAGTGKTTAAKILVKSVPCDLLFLNASDDNNIETVRTKIRGFASSRGFKPLKIAVLDEFDGFTQVGQAAMKNLMEQFSATTRFIMTANHIEKIIEPIISRTQQFGVTPPSKKEVAIHLAKILKTEGVTFTVQDVKYLIDAFFPDIRKVINEAQSASRGGALIINHKQVIENDSKLKLIEILKSSDASTTKFTTARQLLADAGIRDFTDTFRLLFDRVGEYGQKNIPQCILHIAEGQFRDAAVVDKEINMMATIINLLSVIDG